MDFSQIFIFEPPDFFADFLAGFFLLIFVGEKVPRKILEGPGQIISGRPLDVSGMGVSTASDEKATPLKLNPPFP